MDLDQVWKDAIANVISKFTDLKDMSVVKCIETMCSFEVSGNNIVFICNNDMASKMLPMYVSQLFIEITNLMGVVDQISLNLSLLVQHHLVILIIHSNRINT